LRVFRGFDPIPDAGKWAVAAASVDNDTTGNTSDGFHYIGLFDTDTGAAGAQIDLTRTGPETFQLTVDPFGPGTTSVQTGTLSTPGEPIDWIELTFFNTSTDPSFDTDFYIRSMEIFGDAPAGVPGDYNNNGTVDAADYVLWRNGGPLVNEVDAPGTINAADYTAWRERFGNSGSGSGLGAPTVPEPGALVYLGISLVMAVFALSRRRPRAVALAAVFRPRMLQN
jgi:hypothetical protein